MPGTTTPSPSTTMTTEKPSTTRTTTYITSTAITTTPDTTTALWPSTDEKAVLMLSSKNVPMIISFEGHIEKIYEFAYDEGLSAAYSCGATYKNVFWVFGGTDSNKRQVRNFVKLFMIRI